MRVLLLEISILKQFQRIQNNFNKTVINTNYNKSLTRSISKQINKMENIKRVAICQMTATSDKEQNLNCIYNLVADAVADKAQMIFLPEACDYICDNKKDMISNAEPIIGGSLVTKYQDLAKKYDVWLSLGGLHEKDDKNVNKIYNTHIIINGDGNIVQTYRKIHLFDVEIPEKNVRLKESDTASAGSHIVLPVQSPVGYIGMAICYDLRFPELSTQLSKLGADILTYPSAFTFPTGQAHWEILLRSRAIENQCFVIAAAQVGSHNEKRRSYGHAMCVDPWGKIIATCGDKSDKPCYVIAELNYDKLEETRRNMPVFSHRRNDVYNIFNQKVRKSLLDEHMVPSQTDSTNINTISEERDDDNINEEYIYFSKIKVRSSTIFYSTALTYAFVNIRCVVPGHVLVAPKRMAKRTVDMTEEEKSDFFKVVVKVQKVLETVHKTSSSTVTIQDGPDAGQTVEHVHCHVMPRHRGDFKDVDLIYLELANHDVNHGRNVTMPIKPPRELSEMREEAALLKEYFKNDDSN